MARIDEVTRRPHDAGGLIWLGRAVFLFCLFANAAIVLSLRVYPFVDLPFHLAAATIYRDFQSPGSLFSTYFTMRPLAFEPNIIHLLVTGFPSDRVVSVDTMNRLLMCGYVVSLPLIVLLLIRRVGGNGWLALLAFPLVFNFNVAWGFVEFVLAIPLTLMLVYAAMDGDRRPRWTTALVLGFGMVLLFYTHVLAMLFAAAVLLLNLATTARNDRRPWWLLATLAPALGLTCWWWLGRGVPSGESTVAFLGRYYRDEYFQHFVALRRRVLTNDNTQLFGGAAGVTAALLLTAPIVVPPLVWLATRRGRPTALLNDTPRRVLAAFTVVAFACCALLPDRIPEQTALYERFGVFLLLSLVLWSSVLYARIGRSAAIVLCTVALGSTAVRVSYFAAFARDAADFTPALLPDAAPGRTLLGVIYDERFRGHPAYRHFPDYYITWRRGIAVTELTQFRFGLVRANPSGGVLPPFSPPPNTAGLAVGGAHTSYLLLKGAGPLDDGDQFVKIRSAGDWRIYQNTASP